MPIVLALFVCLLVGCTPGANEEKSYIQSDRQLYYQQSVVHPEGLEPNATPYGTPTNASTAGEYDRWIRPDAVSYYPGLE
jgi:ABC-type oligopeptide transport system substrate-binding subunit